MAVLLLIATTVLPFVHAGITADEAAPTRRVAPTFQGIFIADVSRAAAVLMSPDGFREEVVDAIAAIRPGSVRFPANGRTNHLRHVSGVFNRCCILNQDSV